MSNTQEIKPSGVASTVAFSDELRPPKETAQREIQLAEERSQKLREKKDRIIKDIDEQLAFNEKTIAYNKQFVNE